jgi:hypothetical protein
MYINKSLSLAAALLAPLMLVPWVAIAAPHLMPMHPKVSAKLRTRSAPAGATLTYYGGRVVSNMEVVQVLWGTGSYIPQVTSTGTRSVASFYANVLTSPHMDWLTEYNTSGGTNQTIGHGSFLGQYTITPSSHATTVDDTLIQAELANQIAAGHLPRPATDAAGNNNTYYAVFFPHGVTITSGGQASCQYFCAFHGTVAASNSVPEFYYGVHPDFQAGTGCDLGCGASSSTFNNVTSVASHEMVETITDAEVGLASNLAPPLAWYNNSYGEIGDICNGVQGTVLGADGVTYTVQAEYSNVVHDCIISRTVAVGTAPVITSANNALFVASQASSFHVTATGTPAPTFSTTGTLPHGVTLSSSGLLSGTPAQGSGGTYQFTVTANNGTLPNATQSFVLTVQDFKASVTPAYQSVTAGQSVTYAVTFSSNTSLTGTLLLSCAGGPYRTTCRLPYQTTLNGSTTVTATVAVPSGAAKGTYNVVFKGRLGTTSRYAYATLTVK